MTHQVFPDATWIAGHTKPELLDAFAHGDAYHARRRRRGGAERYSHLDCHGAYRSNP